MKIWRHLLAIMVVAVICPATIVSVNMLIGYIFNPQGAAQFLFFYFDECAIPGIVASLLLSYRLATWIERPRKRTHPPT